MTTCSRPAATQQSRGRTPSGWSGCRWERDREWGGTPLAASRVWRLQGDLGPLSPSAACADGCLTTCNQAQASAPLTGTCGYESTGSSHSQATPWTSALGLRQCKESNALNFVVDARQHPQQGPLLPGSGGGGGEITPFGGSMTLFLSSATHFGGAAAPVMNPVLEAIFGNRTAAWVLLFLQCYGEGHALRIAKTFGFGLNMTQRQLKRLEEEGVLVSRLVGNIRLFSFNDRNPTVRNLKELLEAELKLLPNEQVQHYFRERQRPRQSGKALVHHG